MLATIVNKINKKEYLSQQVLNATAVRENLNYIAIFGLPLSIVQHIDTCLICHDVYIDDPTIASDVEHNL